MENNDILFYLTRLTDRDIKKVCKISREEVTYLIKNDKLENSTRKILFDSLKKTFLSNKQYTISIGGAPVATQNKPSNNNNKRKKKKAAPIRAHVVEIEKMLTSLLSEPALESNLSHKPQKFQKFMQKKDYILCEQKLNPTTKEAEKLRLLFLLPEILNNLLKESPKKLVDSSDAKLFLLTKFQELNIFSSIMDKDFFIEQVNSFLKYWIRAKRVPNRFSFSRNCTIKRDGSTVFIDSLGFFSLDNPSLMKYRLEYKWLKYHKNFDLVKKGKEFYVVIPYDSKKINKSDEENLVKPAEFGQGMKVPTLLERMDAYIAFLERVDKAYYKPDMEKLEMSKRTGWSVSGGLPSLGKNR